MTMTVKPRDNVEPPLSPETSSPKGQDIRSQLLAILQKPSKISGAELVGRATKETPHGDPLTQPSNYKLIK